MLRNFNISYHRGLFCAVRTIWGTTKFSGGGTGESSLRKRGSPHYKFFTTYFKNHRSP